VQLTPLATEPVGPFSQGDMPREPIRFEFVDEDNNVADVPTGVYQADVIDPTGLITAATASRYAEDDVTLAFVEFGWPDLDPGIFELDIPGVWRIALRLDGVRLPSTPVVVQRQDGWHNLESIAEGWVNANQLDQATLYSLLEAAREQCEAYAPKLLEGAPVPERYRAAHMLQTRALWQSLTANADPSSVGEFAVPVFSMDYTVKKLLRPPRPGGGS
jgi:hypothetical protein